MSPFNCPSCGKENLDKAKFCTGCGENLSSVSGNHPSSGTSAFVMGDMSCEPEPEDTTNKTRKDTCMGQVLEGKYLILEHLGDGGMGTVYKAEQLTLNKAVAIKILHKNLLQDDVQVKRFQREAWSASRLEHPHSIQIIDFGQTPEGNHYIVMEFLKGKELAEVIRKDYPLPVERIVNILSQVCSVLAEAHANKIIHRDLKPENIVLIDRAEEKDFVKVLDFGIAKLQERDSTKPALTMQGIVCGTPEYMSPEQAMGKDLDQRTDIYSIGCILYEMLTGKVPYDANTYQAILTMHIQGDLTPPSSIAPQNVLPGSVLEKICIKAMACDRTRRYESAIEMKQALEAALSEINGNQAPVIKNMKADKKADAFSKGSSVSSYASTVPASSGAVSHGLGMGAILGIGALVLVIIAGILYAVISGDSIKNDDTSAQAPDSQAVAAADGDADTEKNEVVTTAPLQIKPPAVAQISPRDRARLENELVETGKQSIKTPGSGEELTPEQKQRKALFYYEKGNKALLGRDDRVAVRYFVRSRDYNPNSPQVYKKLGLAYMNLGNNALARENFLTYIKMAPNAADAARYSKLAGSL